MPVARRLVRAVRRRAWSAVDKRFGEQMAELARHRTLIEMWRRTGDGYNVTWLGRQIRQYPADAWLLQEMVAKLRPDAIVETGTLRGGSALYLADLCTLLGHGHVISVDSDPIETPAHDRVSYVTGSSVAAEIVDDVKRRALEHGPNVLVILDSDHSADHVSGELAAYADLVPVGGYIHVQDGWSWNGRSMRLRTAGPRIAAEAFLAERGDFVRDEVVEQRFGLTAHPYGWLRRVRASPHDN